MLLLRINIVMIRFVLVCVCTGRSCALLANQAVETIDALSVDVEGEEEEDEDKVNGNGRGKRHLHAMLDRLLEVKVNHFTANIRTRPSVILILIVHIILLHYV